MIGHTEKELVLKLDKANSGVKLGAVKTEWRAEGMEKG
jgi:hypothetical protein